jgi:hypothetical protein
VIEPPGNVAVSSARRPTSARSTPRTVLIRWWTVGSETSAASDAISTLPVRQTRPRSLRSRSTIMTCSARSLAAVSSAAADGAVGLRGGAARAGPLDRARLDHARGVDGQEALG